jgi:hypothetical protein
MEQGKKSRKANRIKDKTKTIIERTEDRLSVFATAPKTFRIPERFVYQLEFRARQLNTTPGKLLREILKETLPLFEEERSLRMNVVKEFHQLRRIGRLQSVDADALFEEVRSISTLKTV